MSFVHLHTHSEFSALDGLSTVDEIITQAVADDQPAVAITDHGVCAAHPSLSRAANKVGIKPIYGLEAYFVENRLVRPMPINPDLPECETEGIKLANSKLRSDYYHLILLAKNEVGLRNLWALSTESYRTGFYFHPRSDWDSLKKYSEGLIATTACLRGPVSVPLLEGNDELARVRLARLMEIFKDDLYIELHTNQLEKQIELNKTLVEWSHELSIPTVAVTDSHYARETDLDAHKAWIAVQINKDIQDEGDLFGGDQDYFVMPEDRVRKSLSYLPDSDVDQAVGNTEIVADMCHATVVGKTAKPIYTLTSWKGETGENGDVERVIDICLEAWPRKVIHNHAKYQERFEREMKLLIQKGFCGYFLMVWDYVSWAKNQGCLVGPGRGSGGGSLVAYLMGITAIDPVAADLLFERFMTEGRVSLPDFDIDFPSSWRERIQTYVSEHFGEERVVRVGSHTRLKSKGIVQNLGRAMKSVLPPEAYQDLEQVSKIITAAESGTAGLGIPWDDLWAQEGDLLDRFREKYPDLFNMADRLVGRLKTYGRHAAGLVIATEGSLNEELPLRKGEDGEAMISQFDFRDLEEMGYLKFDFLTLRTLDTLQMTKDLLAAQDINIDFEALPHDDQKVWDELCLGHTLGVFQIETTAGTRLARRMLPRNMNDLADMSALVRPGPARSGLTDTYLRRRFGLEEISFPDPRMEPLLQRTYGTLLYQEDVMAACMVLAGYDSNKADDVRKILGKKLVDKVQAAGIEFVAGATQRGMARKDAEVLWAQIAEFAKYGFNRAHAWAYAIIGYWCAWLKFNYPREFLLACLSTVDQDKVSDFIIEARRMGFTVLPPDINDSAEDFTAHDEVIRYGLSAIKGVGVKAVEALMARPEGGWTYQSLLEQRPTDLGILRLLARVGALDSINPHRDRKQLVLALEEPDAVSCAHMKPGYTGGPNGLPCTFNWAEEIIQHSPKTGKRIKDKPLPRKCFAGCRQFLEIPKPVPADYTPFTREEIQQTELDLLGGYITTSPFDVIPDEFQQDLSGADDLLLAENGMYLTAGILQNVRPKKDKKSNNMAFVTLRTRDGDVDAVVFHRVYDGIVNRLRIGRLAVAEIEKTDRGYTLKSYQNL